MDFTGKVVLVTGASRGIGRAVALDFARRGARVAVHYHSNAGAAQQTLAALSGEGHIIVQADMASPADVARMVETVVQQMGDLHILVNNAAIYTDHPLQSVSYADWQAHWRRTIDTNLIGVANASYCAAQHMLTRQNGAPGGRIVNVSSRGAFRGEPSAPAYGASKAGLNALSQSLAVALAPQNIFIGVVAPGWVDTDMAAEYLTGPRGDAIRAQSPLGRVATAEEVAYAVVFLASEGAQFATGAVLDVNGASYLRT